MKKIPRRRVVLVALSLALAGASGSAAAGASAAPGAMASSGHDPRPEAAPSGARGPDPLLAFMLGAVPLASGYYVTSSSHKGLAFTLADAVILGSIWNIRRDETLPDRDVVPYFALLGAVNAADALLSLLQARDDARIRLSVTLTPSGEPKFGLVRHF